MIAPRKPHAALFGNNPADISRVYGRGRHGTLAGLTELRPEIVSAETFASHAPRLRHIEIIFSTWGMPALTPGQIAELPALKAVFYAAGSVKGWARPFLERGIIVASAWAANAVPVAEFTLAQILLSCKGYFRNCLDSKNPDPRLRPPCARGPGIFGQTIGLLGAGQVGLKVIELLKPFSLRVIVADPYLGASDADHMGVRVVSTEQAFAEALVVSNHLPNLPSLRGMIRREHFAAMPPGATFINTGRGAQVVEADLAAVLRERPDLTALLDVTDPEPPPAGSPFYELPNVWLSSHIAGSLGEEVVRMADFMIEEFVRWRDGRPLRYAVTLEMLERLA